MLSRSVPVSVIFVVSFEKILSMQEGLLLGLTCVATEINGVNPEL